MQGAALAVSIVALVMSSLLTFRALRLSRHSNENAVLIGLFTEHRENRHAEARKWVHHEIKKYPDVAIKGLDAVPEEMQRRVRDLAWFYDNLGVLVHHGVVDIEPVSGYLGGSVLDLWPLYQPLVMAEHRVREAKGSRDDDRWQAYFKLLYEAVQACPPDQARRSAAERARTPFRWVQRLTG